MWIIQRLKDIVLKQLVELHWTSVLFIIALYAALTWVALFALGEDNLIQPQNFFYWLVITTSTVGYGDLSPVTPAGRLFVSFVVIPVGLSLFALAVGRLAAASAQFWRKGIMGMKDLNVRDHILVIGWNDQHTLRLLKLLIRENRYQGDRPIVLCTTADIQNPLPDQIQFVRVQAYNNDEQLSRACVADAATIIIDTQSDDISMTCALYCASRNPRAHMIVYFEDESLRSLLKAHCPNVECVPSVSVEMLVKAAADPGSSRLHQELLDAAEGMTQYSAKIPPDSHYTIRQLFLLLKERHDATLIGVSENGSHQIRLNPPLDAVAKPDSTFYYIADERIDAFDWRAVQPITH